MTNEEEKYIFSSGQPIVKKEEDLLQRKKFPKELAASVSNWKEKDSLVLGKLIRGKGLFYIHYLKGDKK